ncbi:MAG TPA: hypothetical protein PKW08_05085 [Flavobacteriaceae bacterium]|nr:endonuclease/exonuclease/phosphatase family protein [Flavobacteriaceae bacterium]MCB9212594.1 endonuclease/exonuclease/phosphatase family protein [Alteromonas sp.]HPF10662.1 hypothetical protein [Flavobacteriaceae bacterium]HQU20944.1 hypothetical protein [Flavobacteriaceae bacterium]HQU64428.1 hypothetical protein [Flavobacteriaceae bacterium]
MFQKVLLVFFSLFAQLFLGQESLKLMSYNLLEFPEANPPNRELILKDILDTYEPDLFMVCELQSGFGGNLILNSSLNDTDSRYASATFIPNQSGSADLQQLLFYRRDKMTLEAESVVQTNVRDINHYTLRLHTANGSVNPIVLEIYIAHLKSSEGGSNQNERLNMVEAFLSDTNSLNPDAYVIFAGDLNLYSSTEPAYVALLDPSNFITMADPIDTPGAWSNNSNFQGVHTQSSRISSGPFGAGAGGGLDDRFDFILVSENLLADPDLHYLEDSYHSYGNNGNCFNLSINDSACDGTYGESLRELLYNMSDHLPVIMQLETDETIVLETPDVVLQGILQLKSTLIPQQLELQFPDNGTHEVVLYNAMGLKIAEHYFSGRENAVWDVSYLPNGFYLLKDVSLPRSKAIKFLKVSI